MTALSLAAASCCVHPVSAAARRPPGVALIAPPDALSDYRFALSRLPRPQNMVFRYAQTRSGPTRVVTEQHLVYFNSRGPERNETTSFNGVSIVPVIVRIFSRAPWPYWADRFAASGEVYNADFNGLGIVSRRHVYSFRLSRPTPADFTLTGLEIDSVRYLPVRETFDVKTPGCSGAGWISFTAAARYWLPEAVSVDCTPPGGGAQPAASAGGGPIKFRESLRFFGWQFPAIIPAQVFGPKTKGVPTAAADLSP